MFVCVPVVYLCLCVCTTSNNMVNNNQQQQQDPVSFVPFNFSKSVLVLALAQKVTLALWEAIRNFTICSFLMNRVRTTAIMCQVMRLVLLRAHINPGIRDIMRLVLLRAQIDPGIRDTAASLASQLLQNL